MVLRAVLEESTIDRDELKLPPKCRGALELTIGEIEHLMEQLTAVGNEILSRGKDLELGETATN